MEAPRKYVSYVQAEQQLFLIAEKHPLEEIRRQAFECINEYNELYHTALLKLYKNKLSVEQENGYFGRKLIF
jgi:hypothetical protein